MDECFGGGSQMFIQIACSMDEAEIYERKVNGLMGGAGAVFVALFIVLYLDYINKVQANNYVEWDVKTVTAGDYTVEFDISKRFY